MSSLVITIDAELSQAALQERLGANGANQDEAIIGLSNLLAGIKAGAYPAAVSIGSASADPVRASGTLTVVYDNLLAGDTVTVAGQVLTCRTTAPAANEFRKQTDAVVTAANLAAAINASATSSAQVSAVAASGVVTVTSHIAGTVGNLIGIVSSGTGVTVNAATLAGGAGGVASSPAVLSFGK